MRFPSVPKMVRLPRLGARRGAPPVPSPPVLSGGAITQVDADLVLAAPFASGYPAPAVSLVSLTRDLVDVTADLIGLVLPNFVTGAYVANWSATNSEGSDTRAISGSFTAPAIAPSFASGPTVTGTPATGETLTVAFTSAGTAPITEAIRWLKNGVEVPGETGLTYLLGTVASLDAFRAEVSLTNAAGTTGFVASNTLTVPDIGTIEGTPVSIAQGVEGDTLADVVTWGSMTATVGTLGSPVREMRLNAGSWATYVGTTALVHPDEWDVRETFTSTTGATRTDTDGPMTVVGAPASLYPVIRDTQDTTISTGSTSLPIDMPAGRVSGDTLFSEVTVDGSPTITATGTWTLVRENQIGSTYKRLLYTKTSDADDTLVLTSSGNETLAARTFAMTGGVSLVSGSVVSLASDVATLDLTTSAPTLWINSLAFDGATAPSADPPTGYTALGGVVTSGTVTSFTGMLFATLETTASEEDAGDWLNRVGTSNRSAVLIGLRNV